MPAGDCYIQELPGITTNNVCWPIQSTPQLVQQQYICTASCHIHAHKCPICGGTGQVPPGFYTKELGYFPGTTTTPTTELCRSCEKGIIWR